MADYSDEADAEARKKAKAATAADVLAELKKSGITDLDDLVKARLKGLKEQPEGSSEEGTGTFCYEGFLYTWNK